MKKLFIALILLAVSLPAFPAQKEYAKTPEILESYEWIQLWDNVSIRFTQPVDVTIIKFVRGQQRILRGFISFKTTRAHGYGYILRQNGKESFCLNSGGCWPVWDRSGNR